MKRTKHVHFLKKHLFESNSKFEARIYSSLKNIANSGDLVGVSYNNTGNVVVISYDIEEQVNTRTIGFK